MKPDEKTKDEADKKQQTDRDHHKTDRDKDHPEERDEFNENHHYARDGYQQRWDIYPCLKCFIVTKLNNFFMIKRESLTNIAFFNYVLLGQCFFYRNSRKLH